MKQVLTYISLILFFLSGTVYVIRNYNQYQVPMLFISVFLILITHFSCVRYLPVPHNIQEISFVLLAVSIMISSFVNREMTMLLSGLGIFVLWVSFSVWLPKDVHFEDHYLKRIYGIILIPYVLLLCYSYITHPISFVRYEGVFRTPNAMGGVTATACAVVLAKLIYDCSENVSKRNMRIDLYLLVFSIFGCMISNCRGANISVLIMCLISVIIIIRNVSNNYQSIVNTIILIFLGIIICFILYKTTAVGLIVQNILNKFQVKSDNPLDGREVRWDIIISRVKVFGNGEKADIGAHNSFLSILDQYGFFSFFFLILFSVSALIKSIKIARNTNIDSNLKYFPLMSCIGFIMLSLSEGMMMKTIMLMAVFCFPLYRGEKMHIKERHNL